VADLEILYDPITLNGGPFTLDVQGLDNIKTDSKFAVTQPIDTSLTLKVPDTVKTDTKLTISIPDTIKTDSKAAIDTKSALDTRSAIDLQPVVVDQCLKLSLGALPPTLVCLPTHQRLGLTLFGVEVFGLTFEGESRVVVSDLPKHPHIINVTAPKVVHNTAAECAAPEPGCGRDDRDDLEHGEHHDHAGHHDQGAPEPGRSGTSPPFVVRLG
jgi:hypothetical protein